MDSTPLPADRQHVVFFRQSGWLMIASIAGGVMSLCVHFLSKRITATQYSIFITFMMLVTCLPTLPLQMVFAQQTASALATDRRRQLAGMIRTAWFWLSAVWLLGAAVALLFQGQIVARWGLTDPAALWVALLMVLFSLWTPIFGGALQGQQNFFWMGWSAILSGIVRLVVAALLVLVLTGGATGMLTGALAGIMLIAGLSMWQTRGLWTGPKEPFDKRALLGKILPLLLGFGACQFLFASDMMFAQPYFSKDEMAAYGVAGTLSRALLWLVLPLAAVMFPKLVHSNAKAEKANLLGMVLLGTAVLTITGGLGLCIVGPLVVKLVSKAEYVQATAALLPWYAGAMVPLALANVLVNDLLARERFRVVPLMVVLAIGYGLTLPYVLNHFPKKLETVLQILGLFNLLLLAVCAWATFGKAKASALRVST